MHRHVAEPRERCGRPQTRAGRPRDSGCFAGVHALVAPSWPPSARRPDERIVFDDSLWVKTGDIEQRTPFSVLPRERTPRTVDPAMSRTAEEIASQPAI